jgi:YD repeat-containing protein
LQFAGENGPLISINRRPKNGAIESHVRSAKGRLNSVTDRRGIKMAYGYDAFGRMTAAVSDQLTGAGGYKQTSYHYEGQKADVRDRSDGHTDEILPVYL